VTQSVRGSSATAQPLVTIAKPVSPNLLLTGSYFQTVKIS